MVLENVLTSLIYMQLSSFLSTTLWVLWDGGFSAGGGLWLWGIEQPPWLSQLATSVAKSGVQLLTPSKANKEARVMESKVCFILDVSNLGVGGSAL